MAATERYIGKIHDLGVCKVFWSVEANSAVNIRWPGILTGFQDGDHTDVLCF